MFIEAKWEKMCQILVVFYSPHIGLDTSHFAAWLFSSSLKPQACSRLFVGFVERSSENHSNTARTTKRLSPFEARTTHRPRNVPPSMVGCLAVPSSLQPQACSRLFVGFVERSSNNHSNTARTTKRLSPFKALTTHRPRNVPPSMVGCLAVASSLKPQASSLKPVPHMCRPEGLKTQGLAPETDRQSRFTHLRQDPLPGLAREKFCAPPYRRCAKKKKGKSAKGKKDTSSSAFSPQAHLGQTALRCNSKPSRRSLTLTQPYDLIDALEPVVRVFPTKEEQISR